MESLPDTRYHSQIVEFFFLTLTPFNGILLEFCWCVKNIEVRIYRKSATLLSNKLRHIKDLIWHLDLTVVARKLEQPEKRIAMKLDFFQIGCFLHWIQSVYPHLFCSLYDNGSLLYLWSPSGLLCWWIFIVPEVVLNLVYLSIFSGLAALMSADIARNLWSLVCSCLNSYWTFHLFPLLFFSNWLLSALNSICLPPFVCSLYDNGSPLYLWSPSGLLCWWIFIVPEVVLNLVYLSIFSGLAALLSADIARNQWSLVCSCCLNSYWTFHLFPLLIFFKLVAFCTEFNLFTPICFVLFMIMDLPYICDHHLVGYSAGGYSLSPRWFLTWYIYPFFQD